MKKIVSRPRTCYDSLVIRWWPNGISATSKVVLIWAENDGQSDDDRYKPHTRYRSRSDQPTMEAGFWT